MILLELSLMTDSGRGVMDVWKGKISKTSEMLQRVLDSTIKTTALSFLTVPSHWPKYDKEFKISASTTSLRLVMLPPPTASWSLMEVSFVSLCVSSSLLSSVHWQDYENHCE